MSDDSNWERAKDLVHEALIRPPEERQAFVRAACGSNEALHVEVVSLLEAHAAAGNFVERPAVQAIGDWPAISADTQTGHDSVLHPGDRIGPYEILGPLGAGGMGEVYQARDRRLNRTVALKVLPASVITDPDFRSRFDREARAIAALNHPHICTLHDVGHQDGVDFLVMEYLEGHTLADRLTKGALPLDQALKIAIEIADALGKAHRQGIVHRDLKPGNVMLTKSGAKLLDFGLAKLRLIDQPVIAGLSSPPTVTRPLTRQGVMVGTLQYMAPEQLEGKEVDARVDVWALGCVLYEMVTGTRPFEGTSQANLIAAILDTAPTPITSRQPLTPPLLDHLVQKCLAKPPEERWQNAQDLATELRWIATQPSVHSPPPKPSRRQVAWSQTGWAAAALAFLTILTMVARSRGRETSIDRVIRMPVPLPEKTRFLRDPTGNYEGPAISPNGRSLAFAAAHGSGDPVLWIRSLDADAARPLAGTEGAQFPFWSPDSEWLGFFANGKLKRVPASGGTPLVVCDAKGLGAGTWNQDGVIVFVPSLYSHLVHVSANGGTLMAATTLDQAGHELAHLFPQFLPDGRHFVYLAQTARVADSIIYVGALGSAERTMVMRGVTSVAYDPSGRLLFGRDGVLMAQSFDLTTFTLFGGPTTIAEHAFVAFDGPTLFSASTNGIVAYRNREVLQYQLTWVDRRGKPVGSVGPTGEWDFGRVSPDGKKMVIMRQETAPAGDDLWMLDLVRGTATRFTDDPSWDNRPIWSPDGHRIVFSSDRAGPANLYVRASDGTTKEERLRQSTSAEYATDWSPDGASIVYAEFPTGALWRLPLIGDQKPAPLVRNNFHNENGRFSPDGRSLAYQSDESGRWEIYSQPLITPGERVRISTNGGTLPEWRRDGKELFYMDPDHRIIAVQLKRDYVNLEPGSPNVLFSTDRSVDWYDVASEGERFLVPVPISGPAPSMTVVVNWPAALRK